RLWVKAGALFPQQFSCSYIQCIYISAEVGKKSSHGMGCSYNCNGAPNSCIGRKLPAYFSGVPVNGKHFTKLPTNQQPVANNCRLGTHRSSIRESKSPFQFE